MAHSRIERLIKRDALTAVTLHWDGLMNEARKLSEAHTERLGARAIDTLHVACGRALNAEIFVTSDRRQLALAKANGLRTRYVDASG